MRNYFIIISMGYIKIIALSVLAFVLSLQVTAQDYSRVRIERLIKIVDSGNKDALGAFCDSINDFENIAAGFTADSLISLSKSRYLSGDKNSGIGLALAATKIFGNDPEGYYNLGTLLSWTGINKDARVHYNKALSLSPGHSKTLYQLSRLNGMDYDMEHETDCTELKRIPSDNKPTALKPEPGEEAVLFAPGVISTAESIEFGCTFSPDGRELYFTRRHKNSYRNVILVSYLDTTGWTIPDTAWFSNGFSDFEPHYSVLGDRIYFGSIRANPEDGRPLSGIWYVEKKDQGWSEARFLSKGMYCSMSADSIMYSGNISGKPDEGISSFNPYNCIKNPRLKTELNKPQPGQHPFISPDGSYILFDSYRDNYCGGESDIYVAFRNRKGTFSDALSLRCKVNGPGADFGASISPDGKYIFFTKHRDIYQVSTDILKKLLYEQNCNEEKNHFK